jgi:two-component system OmpR family response regulator/two-component system copper resistance phosphate regulon response regulator CusR
MHVLLVEDDDILGKSVQRGLREKGFSCDWMQTGRQALAAACEKPVDVILLDLMLPDVQGKDVLERLRARGLQTPVIILSALGSVEERVGGLSAGADDYLVKPYDLAEVVARIEAVARRTQKRPSMQAQVGDLTLDLTTRRAKREGKEIELSPTEFSILEFLMRYAGQVVTRKMLCEHLWESDWEGTTNVVDVHINRLRGKVDRGFSTTMIQTVRGQGYALRAPTGGV